jgi:hypothetical protein
MKYRNVMTAGCSSAPPGRMARGIRGWERVDRRARQPDGPSSTTPKVRTPNERHRRLRNQVGFSTDGGTDVHGRGRRHQHRRAGHQGRHHRTSSHDSTGQWREFIGGMKDAGELSMDINYDPAHPRHDLLEHRRRADQAQDHADRRGRGRRSVRRHHHRVQGPGALRRQAERRPSPSRCPARRSSPRNGAPPRPLLEQGR